MRGPVLVGHDPGLSVQVLLSHYPEIPGIPVPLVVGVLILLCLHHLKPVAHDYVCDVF